MNRSMNNLDKLSDDALRLRLLEYGFPNLPVTDTTRKILIKKLQNYMNIEKAKRYHNVKNITRYSSDEDSSDIDIKKNTFNRRCNFTSIKSEVVSPPISSTKTFSVKKMSPSLSIRKKSNNSLLVSSIRKPQTSYKSIYISPTIESSSNDADDSYNHNYGKRSELLDLSTSSSCRNTKFFNTSLNNNKSLNDSRVQNFASKHYGSSHQNGSNISNTDSQYFSDFTKRLLNLRGETIRESANKATETRQRIISPHLFPQLSLIHSDPNEIINQQIEPRIDQNVSLNVAFSDFWNKLDEQYGVQQTLIPCVLLTILIVFFVLVAFMYMTISPDLKNTINEKVAVYNVCESNSSNFCIEKNSVEDALNLLKLIASELLKRAEINHCIDKTVPDTLSSKELLGLIQNNKEQLNNIDMLKTIKNLHNLEYLISKNPQWRINHVDNNGNILTFEEVVELWKTQENYYIMTNPKLPLMCFLYNKLQKFFLFIGGAGLLLIIFGIIYFIYKFFINYQQFKKNTILHFIDEIISTLMRTAATSSGRNLIVVNHLRDKLIPIHKRKKLEWAWNEALKFLEHNESRIHFSVSTRNGEQVRLMRWLDTDLTEQIDQKSQIKKWHSSAFDKTNKIANPPTPCLKIRQMFDKFEANNPSLKTIIQDAILEKVGPNCKIYDIQLDKVTCCVYVRCASLKDAGIVHNEINGWWFDKKLVSIKFLRLERYLSRFPKSLVGPACLHPSNTQNLSMSQCTNEDNYDLINQEKIEYDDDN